MEVEVVGKIPFFLSTRLFISVGSVIGIISLDPAGGVEGASLLVCVWMTAVPLCGRRAFVLGALGTPAWVSMMQAP